MLLLISLKLLLGLFAVLALVFWVLGFILPDLTYIVVAILLTCAALLVFPEIKQLDIPSHDK
jgi:hypothetical protein